MSDRMKLAMQQADACWEKAMEISPEFVEAYFTVAENLLLCHNEVAGDQFRKACKERKVCLPKELHPNTWVSGPRVLEQLGWITKIRKVVPTALHNHMPSVTLWKSNLTF